MKKTNENYEKIRWGKSNPERNGEAVNHSDNINQEKENCNSMSSFQKMVYMLGPFAIYYLSINILPVVFVAGISGLSGNGVPWASKLASDSGVMSACISMLVFALSGLLIWLLYRKKEQMVITWDRKLFYPIGIGIFLSLGLNLLIGYICQIFQVSQKTQETASYNSQIPLGLGIILYIFISPIVEELAFRWLVFARIQKVLGTAIAVIISALFFGMYHGNILQGIYAYIMGLVLALVYIKGKSLLYPVFLHISANAIIYLAAYLPEGLKKVVVSPFGCAAGLVLGVVLMVFLFRTKTSQPLK